MWNGMNRDADEPKGRDRDRERERERDSSRDSKDSGREVRCGCQYFQTDSLLPERQCLVGTKPVSRPSSRQSHHEVGGSHMTMGLVIITFLFLYFSLMIRLKRITIYTIPEYLLNKIHTILCCIVYYEQINT